MKLMDTDLEKKVLAYCLNPQTASGIFNTDLKSHFYNTFNQNLYVISGGFFRKYQEVINLEALEALLKKKNINEAEILEYRTLYSELKGMEIDIKLIQFYADELESFSLKRSLYQALDKGITDLEKLDGHTTLDNLVHNIAPLKTLAEDTPLVERFVHETIDKRKEEYLYKKEHQEETKGLMFGFEKLDEVTNGLYRKELAMFFGRTGAGKSRVLNNVAYNLADKGEPGILFSLEMYISQLERIFDSRGAKLSYTKIKKGTLTEEEEQQYFTFLDEMKEKKPPLYLVDYSADCTPAFIQSIIREVRKHHDISWICVDYLTLMNPEGKWNSEPEKYGILSRELKQLAKAENIAIITASQSNRDSIKVKKAGTQHVSLSDQITHNCDLIVHLRQTEEQNLQNILQMDIVKYRDGESKVSFELFANFDKNYLGNIKVTKGEVQTCQTPAVKPTAIPVAPTETENLF